MNAPARNARFDGGRQHLRGLIAKVHVAKKELGLDDDSYRQILFDNSGQMSAADCNEVQLRRVLAHFEARGFKAKPGRAKAAGAKSRPAADHPSARKARALFLSLYHLGAFDSSAEPVLEAFARRQLKVAALQWADQSLCYKLIEALKAIAERHGWSQDFAGPMAKFDGPARIRVLKIRLCEAILAKMKAKGLAGEDWMLADALFRLCGLEHENGIFSMSIEDLDVAARALGAKLREARI